MKPIAVDTSALTILLNPNARIPADPQSGEPISYARDRILGFVARIEKERRKLVIPTPVVAELLTAIGPNTADYLRVINRKAVFQVLPFDEISAIELAFLNRDVFASSDQKTGAEPWQKMKVDRQIIAVTKVAKCGAILTGDRGLASRAKLCNIEPLSIADLPVPDQARQHEMDFAEHEELPAEPTG